MNEYNFTEKQAEIISDKAYDKGHSCGYHEELTYAEELADLVKKVIDLNE